MQKRAMNVLIAEAISTPEGPLARFFSSSAAPFHDTVESPLGVEAVHLAEDLPELVSSFLSEHPDVIIINLDHLGEKAFKFCEEVRRLENERHAGIIFYSEQSDPQGFSDLERVLSAGGDDLIDTRASDHEFWSRVLSVYRFKLMTDRLRTANHKLKRLSLTDELTGLSNMRAFNIDYQRMIKSCREGQSGLGLVMFDLDRFKSVNDTANHLVGSFIISEIGHLLRYSGCLPEGSLAARYGGDEYILAVPAHDLREVWEATRKMHDLIIRSVFKKDDFSFKLTASFGIAWAEPGFEGKADDLIRASDLMLYRSKRRGRNQINGLILRYPIDFDNIGESHLVNEDELLALPQPPLKKV